MSLSLRRLCLHLFVCWSNEKASHFFFYEFGLCFPSLSHICAGRGINISCNNVQSMDLIVVELVIASIYWRSTLPQARSYVVEEAG